ncbi:MAG: hypothetical protein ACO1SV_08375 [Fimbriimonas sp.]
MASVVALGAGVVWRNQVGPLSLEEELAAARREGIVVDPGKMPMPALAKGEDGTEAYLKASRLALRVVKGTGWNLEFHPLAGPIDRPTPVASHPPKVRAQLRAVIAKQDAGIAALREAGLRGRFGIDPQWERPFMLERDDIASIRSLTKTLVVRAELRRVEGDLAGAREDAMTLARTAALYRDRRSLTEGFTRVGIEREALRAAHEFAAARPNDPTSPALLRSVVSALGASHDIRQLLSGEVLLSLSYIAAQSRWDPMMRFEPVRNANQAHQVSYWRAVFKALPKDPLDFDGARKALTATANAYRSASIRARATTTHFREIDALAQAEARRRIALTMADVLEYRQRHGKLPTALTNPPADPFGGPIHYLSTASGFVVYSYDRDGVDHRGVPSPGPRRSGDIAARVSL